MNKPIAKGNLIPVRDFAPLYYNKRRKYLGVKVQTIYKAIAAHKNGGEKPDFEYIDKGKEGIWIVYNS